MKPTKQLQRLTSRTARGFTLIELLTVIAIIGILASLIVALTSRAGEKKVRSRVETELKQIEGALEKYKKSQGFYPPDNPKNNAAPPLYYELTGTTPMPSVAAYLNISGIANTASNNYHGQLRPAGFAAIPNSSPAVTLLVVPYRGPNGQFNPWHYVSLKPEHNTESFDLWAEVIINGKATVIANWKE